MVDLEPGRIYVRRELHERFGGQRQSGISTPSRSGVVLIFMGKGGKRYGYRDAWTPEGRLLYSGEGQSGDMEFTRGNKAIRDHEANGKSLLLFENIDARTGPGQVKYLGEVRYVSHSIVPSVDEDQNPRRAIVFEMEPVDSAATLAARRRVRLDG